MPNILVRVDNVTKEEVLRALVIMFSGMKTADGKFQDKNGEKSNVEISNTRRCDNAGDFWVTCTLTDE